MSDSKIPAGGAGADSGAVDSASIDDEDRAPIQNIGSQNDAPGVGTRAADGSMENAAKRAAADAEHDDESADSPEEGPGDGNLPIEEYEPGVDPEHARQSGIVGPGSDSA